jgi:hypothetical protein
MSATMQEAGEPLTPLEAQLSIVELTACDLHAKSFREKTRESLDAIMTDARAIINAAAQARRLLTIQVVA